MMLWRVRIKFMHDLRVSRSTVDEGRDISWYARTAERVYHAIEAEDGYDAQSAALNLTQMELGPIGYVSVEECVPSGVMLPPNEVEDP